jgi:hypothetical protein
MKRADTSLSPARSLSHHTATVSTVCALLATTASTTQLTDAIGSLQDRQTDVTFKRVRATTVAVGKHYISDCVFVALGVQHAMRMRHIVICSLPGPKIFFHVIS